MFEQQERKCLDVFRDNLLKGLPVQLHAENNWAAERPVVKTERLVRGYWNNQARDHGFSLLRDVGQTVRSGQFQTYLEGRTHKILLAQVEERSLG